MEGRVEKSFRLCCSGYHDFEDVMQALFFFLEEVQMMDADPPVDLHLDVSDMPIFVDVGQIRKIMSTLSHYEACFQKVSTLKLVTAPGLQNAIVRGAVAILPFQLPVQVQARPDSAAPTDRRSGA